ncbi:MAG: peptidylprolyl isomerase, partial [Bacteroidota bacterium]|nr:peptidylprolyl isomerase [Bacteroidota bacterium]
MRRLAVVGCVLLGLAGLSGACKSATVSAPNAVGKERPRYAITVTHSGRSIGEILVELFPEVAPLHCVNFDSLVSIGFYDGTAFHRIVPGFVIQGGDPNSKTKPRETWGFGDPLQRRIPAE